MSLFNSPRGEAIAMLHTLKIEALQRKPGWDRRLMGRIMSVVIKYYDSTVCTNDDDDIIHLKFLDAVIRMVETEDKIDRLINRAPVKPKTEELRMGPNGF